MLWLTLKRKIQSVPFSIWILSIVFFFLPLFIDDKSGKYEWIWLVSLIPSFLFAYYYGLKGAVGTAIIYLFIHSLWEFHQVEAEGIIYETSNVYALIATFIIGFTFAIGIGILADKLHRNQKILQESETRYRQLIERFPEAVIVHSKGTILFVNPAGVKLLCANTEEEIIGKQILDFIHPDYHILEKNRLERMRQEEEHVNFSEYKMIRLDGKTIHVESSGTPMVYQTHHAILGMIRDITERKQLEQQLKEANKLLSQLSMLDGLTEIANRRCFDEHLAQEWGRGLRYRTPLSLIMIDVDFFKGFNDQYGHQRGDECLKQVAMILKENINRSCDLIARYGGEEFSIILPDTDEQGALILAKKLRFIVESSQIPNILSDVNQRITISLGVATVTPTAILKPQDLVGRADEALYQAKRQGRNRVVLYTVA